MIKINTLYQEIKLLWYIKMGYMSNLNIVIDRKLFIIKIKGVVFNLNTLSRTSTDTEYIIINNKIWILFKTGQYFFVGFNKYV